MPLLVADDAALIFPSTRLTCCEEMPTPSVGESLIFPSAVPCVNVVKLHMLKPAIPDNEYQRLAALRALRVLDTPAEERFERITRLAQAYFKVPIAVISLVDANREWFKSCQGATVPEGARDISFCGHAILTSEPFIIPNALMDPRFADNPQVVHDGIRFYAGIPVKAVSGHNIGSFCIKDRVAREFTAGDVTILRDFAAIAEAELNLREVSELQQELQSHLCQIEEEKQRLYESELLLNLIADNVADLIAVVDSTGRRIWNNTAYAERLGYSVDELKGSDSLVEVHPDDLALVREAFQNSMMEGRGRRIEYRLRRKDGGWIVLESEGRVARNWNGHERCLVVVARDITARKQEENERQVRSQRQMDRSQILAEFAGSENLQKGDLENCFAVAAQAVRKQSNFQRISVWTMDKKREVLTCSEDSGASPAHSQLFNILGFPEFFGLLKKERVIAVRALQEDSRLREIAPSFMSGGATALLIVPLRRGSEILGALICERTDSVSGWDLDEVNFTIALADGLVLAIDARERLDAYQRLDASQKQLSRELNEAAAYVESLLPPLLQGEVNSEWRYIPSDALGGDAFGYHWIDPNHLAIYLLDVVGHGVRAALVSVAAMNQLRSGLITDAAGLLTNAELLDPKQVLTAMNEAFPMEEQDGMYFTLWYGIYDKAKRCLNYASAGHPPALLFPKNVPEPLQLHTRGLMIGATSGAVYETKSCDVEPGSRLFVFSDGVYEIEMASGATATLRDLIVNLATLADGDLDQVVGASRAIQRPGVSAFADDFSLVRLTFQ